MYSNARDYLHISVVEFALISALFCLFRFLYETIVVL